METLLETLGDKVKFCVDVMVETLENDTISSESGESSEGREDFIDNLNELIGRDNRDGLTELAASAPVLFTLIYEGMDPYQAAVMFYLNGASEAKIVRLANIDTYAPYPKIAIK